MHRGLLVVVALSALLACGDGSPPPSPPLSGTTERERVLGPFLSDHWRLPVPAQGTAPPEFSQAESSLDPTVCGACHPKQHAEWQTSFHAAAYSPGFAGQLIEGELAQPFQLRSCQTCHAPLSEQQPYDSTLRDNAGYTPELRAQGIVCASCHVRAHRHFGPPRRDDLPPLQEPVPHGGFEVRPEYGESRFCAECHQFFDDAGVNGKPLENTFFEWQASTWAAEDRQCQDCHMPDRAHLWRGIHDREMVDGGVDVDLVPVDLGDETLSAALVVANVGVGHHFPTYTTPRVFLAIYQVDATGSELPETRVEATIGREVNLGTMVEVFDTRVPAGESVKLDYAAPRRAAAVALVGRVTVDADYHYRGVFASLLRTYADPDARRLIEEAARRVSDSAYVLAEIRRELPGRPGG